MNLPMRAIYLAGLLWLGYRVPVDGSEITPAGQQLLAVLDAMHVEQLWQAGRQVDWRTGEPNGKVYTNSLKHTHCSAFAAAAAEKLGVYLLHPPEHSAVLLANAQQDWLRGAGTNQGWQPVASAAQAQALANVGELVLVTCKNPNPAAPGHIAIVRPCDKTEAQIQAEGPQVIQAGGHNYTSTSAHEGFKNHPYAFARNELLYFHHPLDLAPISGPPKN